MMVDNCFIKRTVFCFKELAIDRIKVYSGSKCSTRTSSQGIFTGVNYRIVGISS